MKTLWNRLVSLSLAIKVIASSLVVAFLGIGGYFWYQNSQFPANDSDGQLHFWVNDKAVEAGNFSWTENLITSGSPSAIDKTIECPAASTEAFVFLSYPGQERKGILYWPAYAQSAFMAGTTQVLEANLKPSGMVTGQPGPRYVHQSGGNFSLGLACTINNGGNVLWTAYRHATVQAGGGIQVFNK